MDYLGNIKNMTPHLKAISNNGDLEKMKISIVTPVYYPEVSGLCIAIDNRCKVLLDLGHEVQLLIPDYEVPEQKKLIQELNYEKLTVDLYPTRTMELAKKNLKYGKMPAMFKAGKVINKRIMSFNPEVLLLDEPHVFFLSSIFIPKFRRFRKMGMLTICILHSNIIQLYKRLNLFMLARITQKIIPFICNKSDLTICPTNYIENSHGKIKNLAVVNFLGVDKELFKYEDREMHDEIYIISVNRISREKGIDFLYNSAKSLLKKFDNINFIFIGDGPDLEHWQKKQTANIKFTGFIPHNELISYYLKSDIYISACDIEAFGLTIIEAMSTGLPVVVPDTGAASNHFINGESGFSYTAGDQRQFTELIEKLIYNFSLRKKVGLAAHKLPNDWKSSTNNLIEFIDGGMSDQ